jgi:hypothetical protein
MILQRAFKLVHKFLAALPLVKKKNEKKFDALRKEPDFWER